MGRKTECCRFKGECGGEDAKEVELEGKVVAASLRRSRDQRSSLLVVKSVESTLSRPPLQRREKGKESRESASEKGGEDVEEEQKRTVRTRALMRKNEERIANPRADQWMKALLLWCSKMAQRVQVMTADPPRKTKRERRRVRSKQGGAGEKAARTNQCLPLWTGKRIRQRSGRASEEGLMSRGRQEEREREMTHGLQEEQSKEYEDLGSDSGVVVDLSTKSLKSGEDDQDECPGVVEGKRQMDKDCKRDEEERRG